MHESGRRSRELHGHQTHHEVLIPDRSVLTEQVAELSERDYFRDLCFLEMISRVCKRVFRAILRETGEWDLAPAIAHYLNCVVGKAPGPGEINPVTPAKVEDAPKKNEETELKEPGTPPRAESPGKKKKGKKGQGKDEAKNEDGEKKDADGEKAEAADGEKEKSEEIDPAMLDFRPVYMKVTGESIWGDVEEGVWLKYKAQLPEGTRERVRKLSLLRNLCQKVSPRKLSPMPASFNIRKVASEDC